MSKLTGKVAVVTGASKGIGAAIAKSLAAEGASVVVNYASSKAGADAVVAAITAAGGKAVAVPGDVSKAAEAHGIIEAAIKNYGRLDILVNNSGVYGPESSEVRLECYVPSISCARVIPSSLYKCRIDRWRRSPDRVGACETSQSLSIFVWASARIGVGRRRSTSKSLRTSPLP